MVRWEKGERTVQYLLDNGRLESIEAENPGALADALIRRAIEKATAALSGVRALLADSPPDRFVTDAAGGA